jgi:hypothetical protein
MKLESPVKSTMGGQMANLRPNTKGLKPAWPKGVSGNPGGRPKRLLVTEQYIALSETPIPERLRLRLNKKFALELPPGSTWSQAMVMAQFLKATEKGGTDAAKEIREAIEGRVPQRVELAELQRKEVTMQVHFVSPDGTTRTLDQMRDYEFTEQPSQNSAPSDCSKDEPT